MKQADWTEVKDLPTHELIRWEDEITVTPEPPSDSVEADEEPLDPEERRAVLERFTAHRIP